MRAPESDPARSLAVYPAIDVKGGRCVRLEQGRADRETVYAADPAAVAAQFKAVGSAWVHLVDLDGAFAGEPKNWDALASVAALGVNVQFGGGLRERAAVERAFQLGAARVVIGTRAAESEPFVAELVRDFGSRIAVGIDAKDGCVAVRGWVQGTGTEVLALARRMEALGVRTLIHTDIGTDGMLVGPNFAAQEKLLEAVSCQ